MRDQRPIVMIVGPTAGGKTELAIELAERLPGGGECLCADSMQIYRGMDIGTAKPATEEQARVPHHLLDLVDPSDEGFTVDRWRDLAALTIRDVRARHRWPIVVGGTNLYVKALLEGLFEGPEPDPALRCALEALPLHELRERLERIDPEGAARIHPNDRRRTIRAIEVYEQTGRAISVHQQQWDQGTIRRDCVIIGLSYPVPVINRRINARVRQMIASGLFEETKRIHHTTGFGRQAAMAFGYRQLLDHLAGRCSLDEAIEQIKIRTRQYAKQQRTWLRRFRTYPRSLWIEIEANLSPVHLERALAWIDSTSSNAAHNVGHRTGEHD